MKAAAIQHVALVVKDIEKAGRFYEEAFGAKWRVKAVTLGPPGASGVFEGPVNLSVETAMLELSGCLLELFAFNGESSPSWLDKREVLVPHLAIQIDDLPACLTRVEKAGGSRVWPEPMRIGRSLAIYVRDLDGNTFELMDATAEELVGHLLTAFPDAAPGPSD